MNENIIRLDVAVLGAGIGGLGAAWHLKRFDDDFRVFDNNDCFTSNLHNGVHYLHSMPDLPDLPMTIKEVTLTDGIIREFGDVKTAVINRDYTILDSLAYSKKVREIQHPSSIMGVGKRDKVYLPQSNDMNELTETIYKSVGEDKFVFGATVKDINLQDRVITIEHQGLEKYIHYNHVISTLPLWMLKPSMQLESVPIHVTNFKVNGIVPNWLINLYVPFNGTSIYRMSILNNIASFESVEELSDEELDKIPSMFGMFDIDRESAVRSIWKTGKVISIDRDARYQITKELMDKEWYQIGRFGLWNRKLLMDSTIKQARAVVERIHYNINIDKIIAE